MYGLSDKLFVVYGWNVFLRVCVCVKLFLFLPYSSTFRFPFSFPFDSFPSFVIHRYKTFCQILNYCFTTNYKNLLFFLNNNSTLYFAQKPNKSRKKNITNYHKQRTTLSQRRWACVGIGVQILI